MYFCSECGNEFAKWAGKCTACEAWGTIKESETDSMLHGSKKSQKKAKKESFFDEELEENAEESEEVVCQIKEFNRVCFLFKKTILLIGGEPGIGKSTLMGQIAGNIVGTCLYLAGEESISNVKKRIQRVCKEFEKITVVNFFYIEELEKLLQKYKPSLVILDSIHTTRSSDTSGNPKDIILIISFLSRKYNCCFLVVSHITKDGIIAGPKTLEHMVDVVLYLEGDRYGRMRFLRSIKNRFGPTNETGIFEMTSEGMVEVLNPSALFISSKVKGAAGSVVFSGISGSRPLLVEIQALVTDSSFPQVESIGFSNQRLKMILAVLQKWCNIKLWKHDVFVNVVGGIKLQDPSADLPVAVAIMSSLKNRSISPEVCFFGELGLTGEIRQSVDFELRVKEALRLNFSKIYAKSFAENVNNVEMISDLMKLL